jgi:hypothetical protein
MGTTPHTLRCSKCKKGREWRYERDGYDKASAENLVPTGRTKVISRTTAGVYDVQAVELKHICGHFFWSTHPDAVRKVFPNAKHCGNANSRYMRVEKEPSK